MHKPAEATKAELENLYKKHHAYNRLRTDPAIREVTATTLWLHPTLLTDVQALAEKRGIYPNALIVEALAWGMYAGTSTSNEELRLTSGKRNGGVDRGLRCPVPLLRHLKWRAAREGQPLSEVASIILAKYLHKAGALTTITTA